MWLLSAFTIFENLPIGILAKNTFTESVILMSREAKEELDAWLMDPFGTDLPKCFNDFVQNGFLVMDDDLKEWHDLLLMKRNNEAHVFTLHFEPTIQCQLACSYCFENGSDRSQSMKPLVLVRSLEWFRQYVHLHPEIDSLKLKFFGGEPLLCKEMVSQALEAYQSLCQEIGIDFWVEITTNGELLDEQTAELLSHYNWRRVQITLDGPADIHDIRRAGKKGRPTFANIMRNIQMLVSTDYIPVVDIRLTFDEGTRDHLPRLLDELDALNAHPRIKLSLGFTTPSLSITPERMSEEELADTALAIWAYAKQKGFEIPDEFVAGPLCVATAKHSAILQPDGNLQKCFCTSGRKGFNISNVAVQPLTYTKDARFEQWKRTEQCIKERCAYLPVCGGGCTFDAIVKHGEHGGGNRFCQKILLDRMNRGLLRLMYS
ncbi:TPA: hypothetical protein DIV48_03770 [Candidatus Kaiserbacteria bacterium]|nr:MAG: Radical SAM domain protein [Parcubacteria group bacterium GW2011_GWA1_56_13]KKW46624.1 MAG: Radical SAM domain protein [Parcubacteria group bacterium GW2011_GWB1_57_6]HCR52730.1 hypothetical protein [Candidatus Kaiserbacteria bacterium]